MTTTTRAIAAPAPGAALQPTTIERRDLRADDVLIDIAFAGICHSDIHQAREEWGRAIFPMVPGHEIAGTVAAVGEGVTRYRVGDRVGVGCMVDSCGECEYCRAGTEQFCVRGNVQTYNGVGFDGENTYGGYSQQIVVKDAFVCRSRTGSGWTSRRRCSARASPRTRPYGSGAPAPARRSPWSGSAGSGTWASNWPRPWVRRSQCSARA
jgi:uncharacterized zinc-type alcohol dehydrogenase-like protein